MSEQETEHKDELREDVDTLMALGWEMGRWDGLSEVGKPNQPIINKREQAYTEAQEFAEEFCEKYRGTP